MVRFNAKNNKNTSKAKVQNVKPVKAPATLTTHLGVAKVPGQQLSRDVTRAAAAAHLAQMAREWQALGIDLGALHGPGAITDLLNQFGLTDGAGHVLDGVPLPGEEGSSFPGQDGQDGLGDLFNILPHGHNRGLGGLGVPDFNQVKRGLTGYGGDQPTATPVPGQSSSDRSAGGKWESNLLTDGTRVSSGEGWRGGTYQTFTSTEDANGDGKTTTVITTQDGHSATFTDVTEDGNSTTTATGDVDVIVDENERREEGGGNEFDSAPPAPSQNPQPEPAPEPEPTPEPIPPASPYPHDPDGGPISTSVDPDSPYNPGGSWGYFNPYNGMYWGPYIALNDNKVNPGPDGDVTTSTPGPRITMNPIDLVVNPNPVISGSGGLKRPLTPGDIGSTPGGRPIDPHLK